MFSYLKTAFLAVGLAVSLPAQAGIDIGPAVGAKIPPLKALTAEGKPVALSDIAGKSGLVLAFVRSAAWCPYCQTQMIDLKTAQEPLAKQGYTLAVLSYDSPQVLATFAARREIGYTLLSDEKSEMIDAFDIRDPQYPEGSKAHGVPKPAIFVIDTEGRVKAKLAEDGYKVRPIVADLIAAVTAVSAATH